MWGLTAIFSAGVAALFFVITPGCTMDLETVGGRITEGHQVGSCARESTSTGGASSRVGHLRGESTRRTRDLPRGRFGFYGEALRSSDTGQRTSRPDQVVVGLSCRPVDLAEARSSRGVGWRIISTDSANISRALTG